tara:strand:- start:217 stop:429 length:213 start_codon:yes stop_codon:yes gene_type:complete
MKKGDRVLCVQGEPSYTSGVAPIEGKYFFITGVNGVFVSIDDTPPGWMKSRFVVVPRTTIGPYLIDLNDV